MTDLGLEERLARLEARVRRMRVVGFTVLVIVITIALGATLPGVPRTLVTYVGRAGISNNPTPARDSEGAPTATTAQIDSAKFEGVYRAGKLLQGAIGVGISYPKSESSLLLP